MTPVRQTRHRCGGGVNELTGLRQAELLALSHLTDNSTQVEVFTTREKLETPPDERGVPVFAARQEMANCLGIDLGGKNGGN
ncbi:hypothetical protein J6590_039184 [Homalodisca vitripennis]|nr:hypothetical protein J6590_039184 [Homalodisca vitripennis]